MIGEKQPECLVCDDTHIVMVPPLESPQPCRACIAAGRIMQPTMECRVMDAINTAVVVGKPESVSIPDATANTSGIVLVGPGHIPGIGGVMRVVLIPPEGEPLSLTMAPQGLANFSALINKSARALQSGQFDLPAQGGEQ